MNTQAARAIVASYFEEPYPERRPRHVARWTPRGFWLAAAHSFRECAARQRSDSSQNEPWAAKYDRLAEASDVLAEAAA